LVSFRDHLSLEIDMPGKSITNSRLSILCLIENSPTILKPVPLQKRAIYQNVLADVIEVGTPTTQIQNTYSTRGKIPLMDFDRLHPFLFLEDNPALQTHYVY